MCELVSTYDWHAHEPLCEIRMQSSAHLPNSSKLETRSLVSDHCHNADICSVPVYEKHHFLSFFVPFIGHLAHAPVQKKKKEKKGGGEKKKDRERCGGRVGGKQHIP